MSSKIQVKTPKQALEDYLDSIYIQSHSKASVASYRTAIDGKENGFRKIFLNSKKLKFHSSIVTNYFPYQNFRKENAPSYAQKQAMLSNDVRYDF